MLFNSYIFFCFLPIVFLGYRLLLRFGRIWESKLWLILASLYFYSYFKLSYLPLLIASILINYVICVRIQKVRGEKAKQCLTAAGCLFNLGILGYFKYTGFLFENLNLLLGTHWSIGHIILPLGISFYTFQQLSFLIDCCRGERTRYSLTDYALFVTFFPQLIAGPIVLPGEMLPQFHDPERRRLNWENMNTGLYFFACGLAKKCFVADSLAIIANVGFDAATPLTVPEGWLVSLAFTFQLYYDFSGYCDMALGIGKFFNIDLPANFNSPYRAGDFQDFWRRWHITLGRFMRNYLYIPLGGSRCGQLRTLVNLLIVFVVSGLWHGAGWLFLLWGGLHGAGILIHRIWRLFMDKHGNGRSIPHIPAMILTFFFVNIFWIFFRSTTLTGAWNLLRSMFDFSRSMEISEGFKDALRMFDLNRDQLFIILGIFAGTAFLLPNTAVCAHWLKNHPAIRGALTVVFFFGGFICMTRKSPFLYFNF